MKKVHCCNIFFDTGVYSRVGHEIPARDWAFMNRHVRRFYRTPVSWPTFKELVCKLANGPDDFFTMNRAALSLAVHHARWRCGWYLEKPQRFAILHVLGKDIHPPIDREGRPNVPHGKWAEEVVRSILRAHSKRELLQGVRISPRRMGSFDLDDFVEYENQPRKEFVAINEGLRTGIVEPPCPQAFAACLLADSGLVLDAGCASKLSRALDAVNHSVDWLYKASRNHDYDFGKRVNNWDDLQQLYYLCDASMLFVTLNRRDAPVWTRNSTQANQVVLWQDFLAHLKDMTGTERG